MSDGALFQRADRAINAIEAQLVGALRNAGFFVARLDCEPIQEATDGS